MRLKRILTASEYRSEAKQTRRDVLRQRWLTAWRAHALPGLPAWVEEYRPAREVGRKWACDYAWPALRVAVELEGGTWLPKGGHTTGRGYAKNCEKYNWMAAHNWLVFRYTTDMLRDAPAGCVEQVCLVLLPRTQGEVMP